MVYLVQRTAPASRPFTKNRGSAGRQRLSLAKVRQNRYSPKASAGRVYSSAVLPLAKASPLQAASAISGTPSSAAARGANSCAVRALK